MITVEEVRKIAQLSMLSLSDDEAERLAADMDQILDFARQVSDAQFEGEAVFGGADSALREDNVAPSVDQEQILQNAMGERNGYFAVLKRGVPLK